MGVDGLRVAAHFARARWRLDFRDRAALDAWQAARLARFLREVLPRAPRFRGLAGAPLSSLPTMDKAAMMADFAACNTAGIGLDEAMAVALRAEASRDFSPMLPGGIAVGLSSGTSGNRGLFLVSRAERLRWAGVLLARALPPRLLGRLLSPWRAPLRVAFFLRAGSRLYDTLASRRIDFRFFDLLQGLDAALPVLAAQAPDVLVAPPTVLRALCARVQAGELRLRPAHVIAVAEVLEPADAQAVHETLGQRPYTLYQATEGFLGYSCEHGRLHLNEAFVHVEPEWLDTARTRFQPVITDFSRETQLIVRYRLNDVLRVGTEACPCGRAERVIEAVEGRSDEVIWLAGAHGGPAVPVFPDFLRRAMALAGPAVLEFAITQCGDTLQVDLLTAVGSGPVAGAEPGAQPGAVQGAVAAALETLWRQLSARPPVLRFGHWNPPAPGAKRRRVRCERVPPGVACTF